MRPEGKLQLAEMRVNYEQIIQIQKRIPRKNTQEQMPAPKSADTQYKIKTPKVSRTALAVPFISNRCKLVSWLLHSSESRWNLSQIVEYEHSAAFCVVLRVYPSMFFTASVHRIYHVINC